MLLSLLLAGSFSAATAVPNLMLHLRADTGIELSASGHVAKWKDLSPRQAVYQAAKGDTTYRPTVVANGIGGRSAIRFSGSQALQDTSSLPLDSGCTIFIVAQDSSGKGDTTGLLDKGPNDLAMALWAGAAGNFTFSYSWLAAMASSSYDTSAPTLYEASWDGDSTAKLYANGNLLDSAKNSATGTRNKVTTLAGAINKSGTLGNFMKGQIAEIRIYQGVLSVRKRKVVEDSLIARYIDTTKSPSAIAVHSRLANLPRLSQLHDGNLLIEGATPLGLFGIDGRALRFTSTQAPSGMLLKPNKSLAPGQYVLSTSNGTVRFVVMRP